MFRGKSCRILDGAAPALPKFFGRAGARASKLLLANHTRYLPFAAIFGSFVHRMKSVAAKTKPAKAG